MLPTLFAWPNLEQNSLGKRIQTIFDLELSITAISDELVHFSHSVRDKLKAFNEVIVALLLVGLHKFFGLINELFAFLEYFIFILIIDEFLPIIHDNLDVRIH